MSQEIEISQSGYEMKVVFYFKIPRTEEVEFNWIQRLFRKIKSMFVGKTK